jgi:hypothetical protein
MTLSPERISYLKEMVEEYRKFVEDPVANGGLEFLQDCGIDAISNLIEYIDILERGN